MPNFSHSYALVIGIDAYQDGLTPLNNAVNDAQAIADLLESQHGYKVWRLFDQAASREAIAHYLKHELLQRVKADDRLLFCFSGHGIQLSSQDGPEGYLIPQTAQLGQSHTYLSMNEVYQDLSALPCRHLFGILDCCFAGSFRWASQHRKASVVESGTLYQETFSRFIRDPAWQVITSSAYDQEAHDAFDLKNYRGTAAARPQHSPFAAALLNALEGGADTSPPAKAPGKTPGDGVITATELYQYVRDAIEPETARRSRRQTPRLYPLGKHDKGEYIFLAPDHPLNLPPAPPLDRATNPYKGLASFDAADCDRYFGRKEITSELYQFFLQHQLTIVLGPSGSGKSSLVKAGLLPLVSKLDQGKSPWTVLSPFRPGQSPFQALNQVLLERGLPVVSPQSVPTSDLDPCNQPTTSQALLPEVALKNWFAHNPGPLLVVIDQFEELVTRCSDKERQLFLDMLVTALKTYPQQLRAVITLRSDFESQFQSSLLEPFWKASRFQVSALSRQELRQAIEEPAALRVLFFVPPGLVDGLIDGVVNMPGGLPLLSFALSELYLSYLNRQAIAMKQGAAIERAITEADYTALGGVTTALIRRAETEYQQLVQEDAAYVQTIQHVMLRMVALGTGELARRPLLVSEQQFVEPEHSRVQTVLNHFLEARLLVAGTTTYDESFVEPAHDVLVRGWPRLSQWLKQKEIQETVLLIRSLTSVAEQWSCSQQTKSSRGLLWKDDPRLPQALQVMCGASQPEERSGFMHWLWRTVLTKLSFQKQGFWDSLSRSAWLNAQEEQFVKDSLDYQYRRRLTIYSITAFVMTGLIASATFAQVQRNTAEREKAISDIKAQSAKALVWVSTERATEGLILALSALQDSMEYPQEQFEDAQRAVVAAVQNAREQNRFGHGANVRAVAYSPNNLYVASGSDDGQITLWNAETGDLVWSKKADDEGVNAIAFSADGQKLVSAGEDARLKIWHVGSGNQIGEDLAEHTARVSSVAFVSSDGEKVASGSHDRTLRIWDVQSGQVEIEQQHEDAVLAVAFNPKQQQIATGGADGAVRLWNAETGEPIGEPMRGHTGAVFSVAFSIDGSKLVSGSEDRKLRRWDTETQSAIGDALRGHIDEVYAVTFSADDRYIVSAGADRSIRLWDAGSGESSVQILNAHSDVIRAIDVNAESLQIASGGFDNDVRLWDIHAQMPTGQALISDHEASIRSIVMTPDEQYIVSADEKGQIRRWEVSHNRQPSAYIGEHSGAVYSLAVSPNGQQVASTGKDNMLRIWDIHKAAETAAEPAEEPKKAPLEISSYNGEPIYAAAFSPDGETIVSSDGEYNLRFWNLTDGKQIGSPRSAHGSTIYDVAFSPKGDYIVSGSKGDENNLILWDAKNRRPMRMLDGHGSDVWSVAFSPDGQRIASAGADKSIMIWDTQTGELITPLMGHTNVVRSVQFSPDDSDLLVSGSDDRTVRFWSISQEQQIGPALSGHKGGIWSVIFYRENERVFSVGDDLSLRIWPMDWWVWPKMACDRIEHHPMLTRPEEVFDESQQDSIEIAKKTKLACEQVFG